MAWRETRAAWRHFLYFFVCITLGVGALVGVGTFASNVERAVTREARSLMGGDLEVRLTRPISEQGKSFLATLGARGIETTHVSELIAMASQAARAPDRGEGPITRPTQIVELKAVEAGYPFYGVVKTTSDRSLRDLLTSPTETCHSLQDPLTQTVSGEGRERKERIFCHGAIVQESLLIKMGLSVGDHLKIGQATFTITAVVRQEPDRAASAFSLGPRVMISQEGLAAADLIKPGSRVRERYLLRLPPAMPAQPVLVELRSQLAADSARVSSYREAQPQLRRFLDQLTRYLGLVGLTALFVGGIGVASTVHAFLKDKLKTIAILKTLGADSGTVVRTYLVQALGLGLLGSLAGAVLGLSLQGLIPRLLAGFVPHDLLEVTISHTAFPILPVIKGLALGSATTLLFTLWPLLGIREIRPALVFRENVTPVVVSEKTGLAVVCVDPTGRRSLALDHRSGHRARIGRPRHLAGRIVEHRIAVHWRIGGRGPSSASHGEAADDSADARPESAVSRRPPRDGKPPSTRQSGRKCDGLRRHRGHDHCGSLAARAVASPSGWREPSG